MFQVVIGVVLALGTTWWFWTAYVYWLRRPRPTFDDAMTMGFQLFIVGSMLAGAWACVIFGILAQRDFPR